MKKATKEIGVRLHTHSFRIGRITHWLQGNIPIQQVQKLIGHKNIHTTVLYDRWEPYENSILKKLNEIDKAQGYPIL